MKVKISLPVIAAANQDSIACGVIGGASEALLLSCLKDATRLLTEANGTTIKLTGDADDWPLVIDDVIRTEAANPRNWEVVRCWAL